MDNSASKSGKADKKKEDDAGLLYNKLRKLINIVDELRDVGLH